MKDPGNRNGKSSMRRSSRTPRDRTSSVSSRTVLCEYPWTAENDETLLEALNKCGDNYRGDDSPLRTLSFTSHD